MLIPFEREEDRISSSSASVLSITVELDQNYALSPYIYTSLATFIITVRHFTLQSTWSGIVRNREESCGSDLKRKLMEGSEQKHCGGLLVDRFTVYSTTCIVLIVIIQFIIIHNSVTSTRNIFQTDIIEISWFYLLDKGVFYSTELIHKAALKISCQWISDRLLLNFDLAD